MAFPMYVSLVMGIYELSSNFSMKVSYHWLQEYFAEPLPSAPEVRRLLEEHSWEVEGVEEVRGDTIFDIDVLPNRAADSLSHRGIARELSILLDTDMKKDPLREELLEYSNSDALKACVDEDISDTRVTAAYVIGVTVKESPQWLKERLALFGQRSINNVVDATNYVMLAIGQPLHAFDARAFTGETKQVRIKYASENESLELLGGSTVTLDSTDIVVSDGASGRALDVAGVKGGAAAAVTEDTTSIVLTSSHFDPVSIRKTAQRLKLWTDASARLQNNPALMLADHGLREGLELILDVAGGTTLGSASAGAPIEQPQYVGTTTSDINRLLGLTLETDDVIAVLNRWNVPHRSVVPVDELPQLIEQSLGTPYKYGAAFKYQGTSCFDCSSFVRFLYFSVGIALPRVSIDQYLYTERVDKEHLVYGDLIFSKSSDHAANRDTTVVFRAGTTVDVSVGHVGMYVGAGKVVHASSRAGEVVVEDIANSPDFKDVVGYGRVTKDLQAPRLLVEVPFERRDVNISADLTEEIGRIYGYDKLPYQPLPVRAPQRDDEIFLIEERLREVLVSLGLSEVYTYSLTDTGERKLLNALTTEKNYLRASLVPGLRNALTANVKQKMLLGMEHIAIFEIGSIFSADAEQRVCGITTDQKKKQEFFEHIRSVLRETFKKELSYTEVDGVMQIDVAALTPAAVALESYEPMHNVSFTQISPYPFVTRDVAVWTPIGTEEKIIEEIIEKHAGELLQRYDLFDTYTKDDRTSFAYHVVFQSLERTLTDAEVNERMDAIYSSLKEIKGFEIR